MDPEVWRFSAVVPGVWRFSAVVPGVWRSSAVVPGVWRFSAVVPGVCAVVPEVWRLSAVVPGVWRLSAVVPGVWRLSAVVPGVWRLSAVVPRVWRFSAVVPGVWRLSAVVPTVWRFSAVVPGVWRFSAVVPGVWRLSAVVPTVWRFSAVVPGVWRFSAVVPGVWRFSCNKTIFPVILFRLHEGESGSALTGLPQAEGVLPPSARGGISGSYYSLQVIDGYHGVHPGDFYSPKVQQIRMQLLEECLRSSAGPCFVALIGEEYGQPGLPTEIDGDEFENVLNIAEEYKICTKLLQNWYIRDENAVPPTYNLLDKGERLHCDLGKVPTSKV
ncbi:unnamed protein product [Ranitomeya imitator]|uniref:Uncharacterized protein n=1 Tax=Ranitomeya imitator TaxID=111125 RepID=A0ABN9L1P8_9NEOB|nr:unnamed protein product [Ranitomeya imitator]